MRQVTVEESHLGLGRGAGLFIPKEGFLPVGPAEAQAGV